MPAALPLLRLLTPPPGASESDANSDEELLARYVATGAEEALDVLVQRYERLVYHVAFRQTRDRHRAEDVTQATFLVLLQKAKSIRKRHSLPAWLHGTARRIALRLLSKQEPVPASGLHAVHVADSQAMWPVTLEPITEREPLDEIHDASQSQAVDDELAQLPERFRAPLVLFYLEGLTGQQVAERLNLTVATVEGRLKAGRERLRRRLMRQGVSFAVVGSLLDSTTQALSAAPLASPVVNVTPASPVSSSNALTGQASPSAARLASQEIVAMTAAKTTTAVCMTGLVIAGLGLALGFAGGGGRGIGGGTASAAARVSAPVALAQVDANAEPDGPPLDVEPPADIKPPAAEEPEPPANAAAARPALVFAARSPARVRIETALAGPTGVRFHDTPLADAAEYFAELHGIPIVFDVKALVDAGVAADAKATLDVNGLPLRSVIALYLDRASPVDLDVIVQNEVLRLTTKEQAEAFRETVIYKTAHLKMDPVLLADLLTDTIGGPWLIADGDGGTIKPLPDHGGLVVRANQRQHRAIQKLLEELAIYK